LCPIIADGLHPGTVFAAYALVVVIYLIRFRNTILQTEFLLLLTALGFFGLSIVTDLLSIHVPEKFLYLVEDGSKLLGIVGWFVFFTRVSLKHLQMTKQNV
jgi:hypothetical protein